MKSKKAHIFLMITMVSVIVGLVCSSTLAIHIPAGGSNPGGDKIIGGGSGGGSSSGGGSKPRPPAPKPEPKPDPTPTPAPDPKPDPPPRPVHHHTWVSCSAPHCTGSVCYGCDKHSGGSCNGGHRYKWQTTDNGISQTHINKCYRDGGNCGATNGSHTSKWGVANENHTATCKKCDLQYTHTPVWSTKPRRGNEPHPCVWTGEGTCKGTHAPQWGEYYKTNGGKDGDTDGSSHTRNCAVCGIIEVPHGYTNEKWNWLDTSYHIRECKVCGLKHKTEHHFDKTIKKDIDDTNHSELYKHWKICTTCDPEHKHREVDELHRDNGNGICENCGQILWKAISKENGDITEDILKEETAREIRAKREEKVTIIEVIDNNGKAQKQFIKEIVGPDGEKLKSNTSGEFTIINNGKYTFKTGRDGTGTFYIENISRDIILDKILNPMTSTTNNVKITVRTNKAEKRFNKEIYIKEGRLNTTTIIDNELKTGSNPYLLEKTVDKNNNYYFIARDTAGNTKEIVVDVNNIIKGQATVAISNDVFVNGYVFTEILINPDKSWNLNLAANQIINTKVYPVNSNEVNSNEVKIPDEYDIKIVKVMDMQRKDVISNSGEYLPGEYYIRIAIGGKVFDEKGTYIVDLENVNLQSENLSGKNRIIVEVQDLQDLT